MLENNYVPRFDIKDVENFTVHIAEHNSRYGRYTTVEEVAPHFKCMFRAWDNRISYIVTFKELRRLLENHGCSLRHPPGNYIDAYKGEQKAAEVGYPGDTKEVSRQDISTVLRATG